MYYTYYIYYKRKLRFDVIWVSLIVEFFLCCWRKKNKKQKHWSYCFVFRVYIDFFFFVYVKKSVTAPCCMFVLFVCSMFARTCRSRLIIVNPTTLNPIIELIEFWQENRFKVLIGSISDDLANVHRARKWYNIGSNANGKQVPLPIARLFCVSSTSRISLRKM